MNTVADVLTGQANWTVAHCDALAGLRALPNDSISCVVCSPPYYHKRKYNSDSVWGGAADCAHEWGDLLPAFKPGQVPQTKWQNVDAIAAGQKAGAGQFCQLCGAWRGELGHEPTADLFCAHLVSIFAEVKRVLHPTGALWVNLGDSRAGAGRSNHLNTGGRKSDDGGKEHYTPPGHLQPTELVGVPWMFAFAMRAAGWGLYDHITWAKRAPMPESVKRRTTYATEDIFMFGKTGRYYYDQEAIREPNSPTSQMGGRFVGEKKTELVGNGHSGLKVEDNTWAGRNPWSYWLLGEPVDTLWHLGPAPLSEEHYAAYPPEIPRRCIAAGSSEHGICSKCGAPWVRVVERESAPPEVFTKRSGPTDGFVHAGSSVNGEMRGHGQKLQDWRDAHPPLTLGWQPTCKCGAAVVPALVVDIFSGAGTTGLVALRLGRRYIGLELNPDYCALSRRRIIGDVPLFNTPAVTEQPRPLAEQLTLLDGAA